jgi:hypothetical protein
MTVPLTRKQRDGLYEFVRGELGTLGQTCATGDPETVKRAAGAADPADSNGLTSRSPSRLRERRRRRRGGRACWAWAILRT